MKASQIQKNKHEETSGKQDFYARSNLLEASKICYKMNSSSVNQGYSEYKLLPATCFTSIGTFYLIYNDFSIHTTHYTTHTQHTTHYTTRLNDKERWYKWQIRYV